MGAREEFGGVLALDGLREWRRRGEVASSPLNLPDDDWHPSGWSSAQVRGDRSSTLPCNHDGVEDTYILVNRCFHIPFNGLVVLTFRLVLTHFLGASI